MWQRFTERARKVVFHAQEEAQRLGEGYVSTEHLLLGLVRETDSMATSALERLGVAFESVRAEIEKQIPPSQSRAGQDMTLTPRAKRVIDLAYDEARNLGNNYIGTEHLLLGLVREEEGLAARVLAKLGVELEALRSVVMSLQDQRGERLSDSTTSRMDLVSRIATRFGFRPGARPASDTATSPVVTNDQIWERCTPSARAIIDDARERAASAKASGIGAEHLLLALLDAPECRGTRAVATLAPDLDRIRRVAEALAIGGAEAEVPDPLPFSPSGQMAIASADVASVRMGNPFVGTEHLALVLFGGAAGEFVEPEALAPGRVREAVARSQAED